MSDDRRNLNIVPFFQKKERKREEREEKEERRKSS